MKRVTKSDFTTIAEFVCDEHQRRKNNRKDFDKRCDEVDRQLRMEPDIWHKLAEDGRSIDNTKKWMPEMELPLQSQTLEVLTADARRMMEGSPWFSPHAALTDEYLEKNDFSSLITGDSNEVPTLIDQDAADKLVYGVLNHFHRQYDFWGHIDLINADAFKYGFGVGRARKVKKTVFMNTAKGIVSKDQMIPVLVPRSARHTYLDDSKHAMMNEGHIVGSSVIFAGTMKLKDLQMAAAKGSNDPEKMDGGWIPRNLKNIEPDKHGEVDVLEWSGDLVVPRKSGPSLFFPNVIVTVVKGQGQKAHEAVVRFRFTDLPFSPEIIFPYHCEDVRHPYPTSPLIKGWPIQKAAADALNRLIELGALNSQPPLAYDGDDPAYASSGGPRVYPGALWPTTGDIKAVQIGDPSSMLQVYVSLLQQYADVTGVNAPRLGAQTVSHTTAFAKEAEMSRGTVRTVDYVKSALKGPLAQWLHAAYYMGRDSLSPTDIYIEAYNGFASVQKKNLPELVEFDVHGAGGPQEEVAKGQQRLQALQLALQVDQLRVQYAMQGVDSKIDFNAAIEQILREGKWNDVDTILKSGGGVSQGPQNFPGMDGNPAQAATAPGAALQALAQQTGQF